MYSINCFFQINDQDNKEDNAEQADDTQASDNIEANDDETKDEEVPLDFTSVYNFHAAVL